MRPAGRGAVRDLVRGKTAKDRNKYVALDDGTSGAFLLEKTTGLVYRIKAYGVKGRLVKHLDQLIAEYREANIKNAELGYRWASAHSKK